MTATAEVIFYFISFVGLAFAIIGIGVYAVRTFWFKEPEVFSDSPIGGFAGVGLVLAAVGFLASRAASTGAMPEVGDKCIFVFMFVVVSGGFGVALNLTKAGARWNTAWSWPLILSTLMGISGGLSAVTF